MRGIKEQNEMYKENIHYGMRRDINGVTLSRRD